MQYFVVMIDYGRRGREAVVDPEITRREVVSRIVSGEYRNISFIHEIASSAVEDVTADILAEAALPEIETEDVDLQARHSIMSATSASMNRRDHRSRFLVPIFRDSQMHSARCHTPVARTTQGRERPSAQR